MIEPYATAIRNVSGKFSGLGFASVSDADYSTSLSNGDYSIDIAVEKNYHPSLSMSLRNRRGKHFELGTVKKILAPERADGDQQALRLIREKYGLDDPNTERSVRAKGVLEYAQAILEQMLNFMTDFRGQVFASPGGFEAEYEAWEQAFLSKLQGR
jgi:hypothetical protein